MPLSVTGSPIIDFLSTDYYKLEGSKISLSLLEKGEKIFLNISFSSRWDFFGSHQWLVTMSPCHQAIPYFHFVILSSCHIVLPSGKIPSKANKILGIALRVFFSAHSLKFANLVLRNGIGAPFSSTFSGFQIILIN